MVTLSSEKSVEAKGSKKVASALGALGGLAIVTAGLIAGAEHMSSSNDPAADTYVARYTAPGECLDNTVYDLDHGATAQEAIQGERGTLTVHPTGADPIFGSGLQFTFDYPDGSDFRVADNPTRLILSEHHCG